MTKIKVGLVGLGEIAQIVHLPILQEYSDKFEIAALCDISQELLAALGERYNVPPQSRYTDYHDIAAQWRAWGVTPDKRIAFYCGTGWRASEAFFYAYLMGWATIAVYDGGWWAWVQNPANLITVGNPGSSLSLRDALSTAVL